MKTIRLIIADDHALFRQGLIALLRYETGFEIVAEVSRASDLTSVLATTPCDVLLLDLQMERWLLNEIDSLARLTRVVVVTASEGTPDALAALRLGAAAIVHKAFAFETLATAIRAAADGLTWMPPTVQADLTEQWRSTGDSRLTVREGEIVRSVALGLSNAEVATRLGITEGTVKTHLNNIFKKLGVRDRVGLVLHALQMGLGAKAEHGS